MALTGRHLPQTSGRWNGGGEGERTGQRNKVPGGNGHPGGGMRKFLIADLCRMTRPLRGLGVEVCMCGAKFKSSVRQGVGCHGSKRGTKRGRGGTRFALVRSLKNLSASSSKDGTVAIVTVSSGGRTSQGF